MTAERITDQFKGMFWGLVVGDCLGSPVQFTEKDGHEYVTEMKFCSNFNTPPGYWTDDSALAFCVAESYVRCEKYDLDDIANNFARWFYKGFWSSLPYAFDVGGATCSAIRNMCAGGSLKNGTEQMQGNGSIMRFAPSFIINFGEPDKTIIHEISSLTHASSVVAGVIDKMDQILSDHVSGRKTSIKSIYKNREEVNNSGWAVSTLNAALWAFENSKTFEEGMILAVNLGGDADTIGAVYGQIAGAWYGFEAIPRRWLDSIKDQSKINDLIESLLTKKNIGNNNVN